MQRKLDEFGLLAINDTVAHDVEQRKLLAKGPARVYTYI
jgi:hypothetical protein